jgi:AraC family transcriptional regulator, transcriptional activator of pobA
MSKTKNQIPLHFYKTKEMGSLGFDIINLKKNEGRVYDSSIPHRHSFFELFLFTKGKGIHEIDFNQITIDSNSAHFVSPGQVHKLMLTNIEGYVLCFTEDFVSLKQKENVEDVFPFYNTSNTSGLKLSQAQNKEIETLILLIMAERQLKGEANHDVLRSYLNIILLKIKSVYMAAHKPDNSEEQTRHTKVAEFKKRIQVFYLQHKAVADYAKELTISPNYLNALCKLQEGKTAIQLIQDRLLLEAKRLLYATELNIKEISFYLKFEDVAYFNRFFKKQTQFSPIQYRQQLLKNR